MILKIITWLLCIAGAVGWSHPGVLVSAPQLDRMRAGVLAQKEPMYTQFQKAKASHYGSAAYVAKGPPANGVIQCGPYSNPNIGCSDADDDSAAAYTQSLLWYITGTDSYRKNAETILNKYAQNLKGYAGASKGIACSASSCSNGPLQAGWDAAKWPRAAEILRYGHGGAANWSDANWQQLQQMLRSVYLPILYPSRFYENWGLTMIEGLFGIATVTENATLLAYSRAMWSDRVPKHFFNYAADYPKYHSHVPSPANWFGQLVFSNTTSGVSAETCRDLGHTEFGIAAAINAAETDWIQAGNLYQSQAARLMLSLELHAGLELKKSTTAPPYFCTGAGNRLSLGAGTTYVIGYYNYAVRNNNSLPHVRQWIVQGGYSQVFTFDHGAHMVIFEGLTHGV